MRHVCVCVWLCVCARKCACACVWLRARARVCVALCVCARACVVLVCGAGKCECGCVWRASVVWCVRGVAVGLSEPGSLVWETDWEGTLCTFGSVFAPRIQIIPREWLPVTCRVGVGRKRRAIPDRPPPLADAPERDGARPPEPVSQSVVNKQKHRSPPSPRHSLAQPGTAESTGGPTPWLRGPWGGT